MTMNVVDQPVEEIVGGGLAPADTFTDQPDDQVEIDPQEEFRAQLAKLAPLADINPAQLKSSLGRIASLQSTLDRMQASDPTAAITARLEEFENYLDEVAYAISESDIDESARQRVMGVRSQRQQAANYAATVERIKREVAPPTPQPLAPAWQDAQDDVVTKANELGIDPNSIPRNVWQAAENTGSPYKAVVFITDWLSTQKEPEETPTRVAARKTAAAGGSPTRAAGAVLTDEQLWDDYGNNPAKYINVDAKKRVVEAGKRLGYTR